MPQGGVGFSHWSRFLFPLLFFFCLFFPTVTEIIEAAGITLLMRSRSLDGFDTRWRSLPVVYSGYGSFFSHLAGSNKHLFIP